LERRRKLGLRMDIMRRMKNQKEEMVLILNHPKKEELKEIKKKNLDQRVLKVFLRIKIEP
jgi:hypothetical protein